MSYNPSDKPTVPQLCTGLSSISDWQCFAIHLPGIEIKHIRRIENKHHDIDRQKIYLFEKWLDIHPSAAWSDVDGALRSIDKVSLATSLVNLACAEKGTLTSSQVPLIQQQVAEVSEKVKHLELNIAEEDDVAETLIELYDKFAEIIYKVKTDFVSLVTQQPAQLQSIVRFAEDAVSPSQLVHLAASNIEEFFHRLRPYYDFLECRVITTIAKQFIGGKVMQELQAHSLNANEFRRTAPIKQLAKDLRQCFTGVGDLPTLDVKLETPWEDVVIDGLYVLIEHLLPNAVKKHAQYSLINNIVIAEGCLLLQYGIRDPSMIDTIIQHLHRKTEFMRLIGIFQLAVDGRYAIFESEDVSFSFNTSLLNATKASNNAAIQFLIDIGADVNYQDYNDGFTALMLAVAINNIDTVQLLLQAGADVNIQNQDGATALIGACLGSTWALPPLAYRLSNDFSNTVRLLLSHGADPVANVEVGGAGILASPFDIACIADNSDIVDLLLTECYIPFETAVSGLYVATCEGAVNTVDLLHSKIHGIN